MVLGQDVLEAGQKFRLNKLPSWWPQNQPWFRYIYCNSRIFFHYVDLMRSLFDLFELVRQLSLYIFRSFFDFLIDALCRASNNDLTGNKDKKCERTQL